MSNDLGKLANLAKPKIIPVLDQGFRPAVLANKAFRRLVAESGNPVPLVIGLERANGTTSRFETAVLPADHPDVGMNYPYIERLVKFLLWMKGGWKVSIGGPKEIGEYITRVYSPSGEREFDYNFHGQSVSEKDFTVVITDADKVAPAHEVGASIGRHLEGYRIGFDLGASDRKVSAVVNGEPIYTEEVNWNPRDNTDPAYHYAEVNAALKTAASKMPRVDAIGGSSAGVIMNNRPMVASLFRGIPKERYGKIREMFVDLGKEWGVPMVVVNDGDVTALAGAMSLGENAILGVAMGSSEAAGYVDPNGNITGWLNELAFCPMDYRVNAPKDEWSGDDGCGVQFMSQQAVFRLAPTVDIHLDEKADLADRLKSVQDLMHAGDKRAIDIWNTIGVYVGYAVAHYADFYDVHHVLILGRVTSGDGGDIIIAKAQEVLDTEFPDLAKKLKINLPDEKSRRVGQAVAAASLPEIK